MAEKFNGRPVTVIAVGAGHRTVGYCSYALAHPQRMKVVAVCEPDERRRNAIADAHAVPASLRFKSFKDVCQGARIADVAINGTMDRMHYPSAKPMLEAGYHMLLEKPIATEEAHVRDLIDTAKRNRLTVMICHVLRYAPFYRSIKRLIGEGAIGDIVSMRSTENVSYHHMAVGFIRGRWRKTADSNPMLLAKCCHDMDIIAWLNSGVPVQRVASFGSLKQFRPENAPEGSGKRCLGDCQIESTCQYSAKKNYVEQGFWGFYAWEPIEHIRNATVEQKLESLRTDNPFGRCVWHCDNDVVDHQNVIVEFANGVTATHDMFCATARPSRTIHIVGTQGEIEGDMEAGRLKVRKPWAEKGHEFAEEDIDVNITGGGGAGGHGGGDAGLIEDFVATIRGEETSQAATRIEDSLYGHLIAFAADTSMREHRVIEVDP